jgi:hypothetical protein
MSHLFLSRNIEDENAWTGDTRASAAPAPDYRAYVAGGGGGRGGSGGGGVLARELGVGVPYGVRPGERLLLTMPSGQTLAVAVPAAAAAATGGGGGGGGGGESFVRVHRVAVPKALRARRVNRRRRRGRWGGAQGRGCDPLHARDRRRSARGPAPAQWRVRVPAVSTTPYQCYGCGGRSWDRKNVEPSGNLSQF